MHSKKFLRKLTKFDLLHRYISLLNNSIAKKKIEKKLEQPYLLKDD